MKIRYPLFWAAIVFSQILYGYKLTPPLDLVKNKQQRSLQCEAINFEKTSDNLSSSLQDENAVDYGEYNPPPEGCPPCLENALTNGDFELPDLGGVGIVQIDQAAVPSWQTTSQDGLIEIWEDGFNNTPAQSGNNFAEINATQDAILYQLVCAAPGTVFEWSVWHRGRSGVDVAEVLIGPDLIDATRQELMTTGLTWENYTGIYTVPAGQIQTLFAFGSVSTAGSGNNTVGNFIDNITITIIEEGTWPVLDFSASSTSTSCSGFNDGSIELDVTNGEPGYTYDWSNGQTSGSGLGTTIPSLNGGIYSVTVTDANGCENTTTVQVPEPPGFVVNTYTNDPTCNGDNDGTIELDVNVDEPYLYNWTNGQISGSGSGTLIENLPAGSYTIEVIVEGCSTTTFATLTEPSPLDVVAIASNVSCGNDSDGNIILSSANTEIVSYSWDNGVDFDNGTGSVIENLAAGNYNIQVIDENACIAITSAIIEAPNVVGLTLTPINNSCGSTDNAMLINVTNYTESYTYDWTNGINSGSGSSGYLFNLSSGVYTFTVTDALGCEATSTTTIDSGTALVLDVNPTNALCGGLGNIMLDIQSGTPGYSYEWSNDNNTGNGIGTNIQDLEVGTYNLTVTDDAGCVTIETAEILETGDITTAIQDSVICESGNVQFIITGIGGTARYTYEWNNGLGTAANPSVGFGDTNIYMVTVTDANGCTATNQASAPPALIDTDGDGKPDACDICPTLNNQLIGTPCNDGDSLTVNDVYTIDCICEGKPTCVDVVLRVFLEGPYDANTGLMSNELNQARGLLPGQTPTNPLVSPTVDGQPYNQSFWNYPGLEGEGWTNGNYLEDVVDWVLISFRTGTNKSTQAAIGAGLVYRDGSVSFTNDCVLPYKEGADSVYIVVEHRNHMGVMTPSPIYFNNYTVEYDFTLQNSYVDSLGTGAGQIQFSDGKWGLHGGDDNQSDFPSYDINGLDKANWQIMNGAFDIYNSADYNMNGDVNGDDKIIWKRNNGLSSRVPK